MSVVIPPSALPDIFPSSGEIGLGRSPFLIDNVEIGARGCRKSISPLERKMRGRADGGKRQRWTR
jgi:hypothetical protein